MREPTYLNGLSGYRSILGKRDEHIGAVFHLRLQQDTSVHRGTRGSWKFLLHA
jgi:hypothetical protein